jgi:serine/threonine protein kinase
VIKDLRASDPVAVGPYKLLGRLGAGGMGQVFLAKSPGGRLVAIKLIRPELAEERGFRTRFAGEISAARNVSGIYTAAVVDADAEAELPWMATVYVPGPSLTDAVEDNGPLPVTSVLALAAGLAEALEAIHRAGLVHRDMKPSNVLLASDGPRVIDFGISRVLERSMMTTTGMVLGSPGFMSPEQAMGEQVGQPTDVFSLGAILAYASTGAGPFGTGPTPALLYRVVREEPDLTGVPDRVRPLVEQCLAKDPAVRPTPAALLGSLSDDIGVLDGEWLPPAIADGMSRYNPTLQTPLPPSLRDPDSGPAEPAAAGDEHAGPLPGTPLPGTPLPGAPVPAVPLSAGPVSASSVSASSVSASPVSASAASSAARATPPPATELAAATPLPGAALPGAPVPGAPAAGGLTAPTRAEYSLPETSLLAQTGAGGRGEPPGGAGPAVAPFPARPGGPDRRRRRRWPLAAAAAAAVVIIAVVALALGHSSGGSPGQNPVPSASLAGDLTAAPSGTASGSASPTTPGKQTATAPVSRQASVAASTRAATPTTSASSTWKSTATASPTWTPTPTSSATATSSPTWTPTTSTTTTAPTSDPTSGSSASPAASQ